MAQFKYPDMVFSLVGCPVTGHRHPSESAQMMNLLATHPEEFVSPLLGSHTAGSLEWGPGRLRAYPRTTKHPGCSAAAGVLAGVFG
jgi:hypothetical protein